MENLTTGYLIRAEIWLCTTVLIYFLMNGAQVFETFVFVPKWMASPPDNFGLLTDGPGAGLKLFWIVMHSIHEIAFILALIFCWKIDQVRNGLLMLFLLHFAIRAWTIAYFAPSVIEFQKMTQTTSFTSDLLHKTTLWQKLNYVRVALYILISFGLIPFCLKLFSLRT